MSSVTSRTQPPARPAPRSAPTIGVAARLDRIPPFKLHRRMGVAVGFGNFFDLYDIFLGGVLAAVLAEAWGLSTNGKALVIASGFGGMFVGAITFGRLADRIGRRRTFLIEILVYSAFTLAAAFSPNLAVLAVLRFCAGIGLGGELSLADTYLSEILPRQVRGRYMAMAFTLSFFGVPLAAFIGAKFVADQSLLIDGWRWLMIVGSLGAVVVWAMRRNLPESPRWHEIRGDHEAADRAARVIEDARARRPRRRRAARARADPADARAQVHGARDLRAALPAALDDAVDLPVPADRRLLRLRHAGAAGAGLQGLRHRRHARLHRGDLPRLPAGLGAVDPAHGALRAQAPDHRLGHGDRGFGMVFGFAQASWLILVAGFATTAVSNVFSNSFHIYQAEIFPTRIRATAVGTAYSLSRLSGAMLPFISVTVLDHLGATAVFVGSAVIMLVLCVDIAMLGPRSTGLNLEDAADEELPTADEAPRFHKAAPVT